MTEDFTSFELKVTQPQDMDLLLGTHDKHVKLIEDATKTTIRARGEVIQIQGEKTSVDLVVAVFQSLQELIKRGIEINTPDVVSALNLANQLQP